LLEAGERENGITELETTLAGFVEDGDIESAFDVADELVRVGGGQIAHHQRRVELAVKLGEKNRLRDAYLDLADLLVRLGADARAHAVYARVLELDPWDERARLALGSAAPPPPRPTPHSVETQRAEGEDSFASWLHEEDDAGSTRMRMQEPAHTGDELADFDSLLRHFKEGVARSLGDEDHESHYDLGVAYKEMGLLDDAIEEFQKALRSRTHRLPAYEALGQCFVEQGRHQVATTVLARALHEPGLDDHLRVGVLYLLGHSSEALERFGDARSYFDRVHATDRNFRDVAARLAALPQQTQ
jgi:tetratricopeptide (TPR) repeat protein